MRRLGFFILFIWLLAGCSGGDSRPLWTADELSTSTARCAQAGGGSNSRAVWEAYCHCVYKAASTQWNYTQFSEDFFTFYDALSQDGTQTRCRSEAGLSSTR